MRILIVDDDPSLRQMLEVTFDVDARISVVRSASTPEEALEVAAALDPHVVVVDNVLNADGTEIGKHLRELLPGARLISFSGTERVATWADAHITKNSESVENLTRSIFREAGSDTPAPEAKQSDDDDEIRRFIHDIRNPIGALVGFSHILKTQKGKLSEEQQDGVAESMLRTSERLSKLVEEFSARRDDQR